MKILLNSILDNMLEGHWYEVKKSSTVDEKETLLRMTDQMSKYSLFLWITIIIIIEKVVEIVCHFHVFAHYFHEIENGEVYLLIV